MDASRVSVLIVDDHEVVRRGIRAFLDTVSDIHVVGEAAWTIRLAAPWAATISLNRSARAG
jgi:DNA-binding NarL/FixJ family response regulator